MSGSRPAALIVWFIAACTFRALTAPTVCAEDAESAAVKRPPLEFRRIYAPADRVADWPLGDDRYVPIERAEFERLIEIDAADAPPRQAARVTEAAFEARLVDGDVLTGEARCEIAHASGGPALLSLGACNFAIGSARWEGDNPGPAVIGSAADGRLKVLTPRSAVLHFDWSLRGRRTASGSVKFDLKLPTCVCSRLTVDLPTALAAAADAPVLSQTAGAPAGLRRWRVDLGGRDRLTLSAAAEERSGERRNLTLLRQSSSYEFSPRGVDVSAQLKLDVHSEPLSRLVLELEPGLSLIAVHHGEASIPWTLTDEAGKPRRAVLVFAEPLSGPGQVLQVSAVAPLVGGKPWRLPSVRPQEVFWQEGSTTLLVPRPLVLGEIRTSGCRQTKVAVLSGGAGESLEFQSYAAEAELEVVLERAAEQCKIDSGSWIELGSKEITSEIAAQVEMRQGERFALSADVAPQWVIDSVEAAGQALLDWSLEPADGKSQRLSIRLAHAVSPQRALRLSIAGHRPCVVGEKFAYRDLQMVRFSGVDSGRAINSIQAAPGHELSISGADELIRLDPNRLTPSDARLFNKPPAGLIFAADSGAGSLRLELAQRKPGFDVDVDIDAAVHASSLTEAYLFRLTPQSGRLDRVLIQFSQRHPSTLQWLLAGANTGNLAARRFTAEERAALGPGAAAEVWEINLRLARPGPFELRAICEEPFTGPRAVSLASVLDARQQRGTLTVRSLGESPPAIENRGLKPITPEQLPASQVQTARAAFRYVPARDGLNPETTVVLSQRPLDHANAGAWAWSCRLESRLSREGAAVHQAVYRIETSGRTRVQFKLPSGAQLREAAVDDKKSPLALIESYKDVLSVELPPGRKFVSVSLSYLTDEPLPVLLRRTEAMLPEADLPVMNHRWSVWLPTGYELLGSDVTRRGKPADRLSWRGRLFGPLGREPGQPVFDPTSAEQWTDWPMNKSPGPEVETDRKPNGVAAGVWNTGGPPTAWEPESGWNEFDLSIPADGRAGAFLVSTPAVRSLGWAMFLVVVGWGAWRKSRQPARWLLFAGALGCAALLLPAVWAPVCSSAFLGALFWLLVLIAGPALGMRPSRPASTEHRDRSVLEHALLVAPIAGLFCWAMSGTAAEPKTAADPSTADVKSAVETKAAATIYKVFAPIDEQQRPTGGKYQVPEALYNELYRRAAEVAQEPAGWMITRAVYQGALLRDRARKDPSVLRLGAAYDLLVFEQNARVRLPIDRESSGLTPAGVKLDGRDPRVEWDEAGILGFTVAEPGLYRLELVLQAATQQFGPLAGFDIGIPALNGAQLDLTVPSDLRGIEVLGAQAAVTGSAAQGKIQAALGAAARLSVRWPSAGPSETAANFEVEQLSWMKVQPGSIVLDAKLKLRVLGGRVRQLRLLADPALRLLPAGKPDPLISEVRAEPGDPQVIELDFGKPIAEQAVIELRFLLTGASGVGNLRLPRLEAAGARSAKHWLAISTDPNLQQEDQSGDGVRPLALTDFAAAWGASEAKPQIAFALTNGVDPALVVATRPRRAHTAAEQIVTAVIGRDSTSLRLDAQLNTSLGANFQIRLLADRELVIDSVSVLEEGLQRAARFARDAEGRITIFLSGAVTGRQQLLFKAHIATPQAGVFALGLPRIESGEVLSNQLQVFRRSDAVVEVTPEPLWLAAEAPPVDKALLESASLVGCYKLPAAATLAVLRVTENSLAMRGVQVTSLRPEGSGWIAEVDLQLQVSAGLLDGLRLDIPPQWAEPFKLDRPATVQVVSIPGENRQQLIVRPHAPVKESYGIKIQGQLALAAGERLRAPDISPHGFSAMERFVVLPTQVELQPANWEKLGLREAQLPAEFRKLPVAPESFAAYQVLGDHFQAALKGADRPDGKPHVRLADYQVAWSLDGNVSGAATFDLDPAGASECLLQLPEDFQLLHVFVAGLPGIATPVSKQAYRVPLGSEQLPQCIDVVFAGRLDPAARQGAEVRLAAPSLRNVEVERTLWTIYGPSSLGAGEPPHPGSTVSRERQRLLRLSALADELNLGAEIAADQPTEDVSRWVRPWMHRLASARASARRSGAALAKDDHLEADSRATERELTAAQQRLGTLAVAPPDLSADSPSDLMSLALGQNQPLACTLRGSSSSIGVRYAGLGQGTISQRLLWALYLVIGVVAAALLWARRAPALSARWLGAGLGIFWWLNLTPSGLGLVIAMGSVLLLRRRAPRSADATGNAVHA